MTEAAPFPPAVRATIDWLQDQFRGYYRDHPPALPERFTRREFGFILWPDRPGPPPFLRHRAYADGGRFQRYLAWRGPHSAYYSTAFYRKPGEAKMVDKAWLGAELIFDLDADHLTEVEAAAAGGEAIGMEGQLRLVKQQFRRLLDDFVLGDLGIDERHVSINFSGSRGYHAHITDPKVLGFDARARREIVDYVTGKVPTRQGNDRPDVTVFLHKEAVAAVGQGRFQKVSAAYRLAPASTPGWPGRLTKTLVDALRQNVFEVERPDARKWLMRLDGVGPKTADDFLAKIERLHAASARDPRRKDALDLLLEGRLSHKGDPLVKICEHILEEQAIPMAKGETDEPVTADVKRLIRLPGSLHGKGGLVAKRLTLDELADFDPLRDAVAFGMDPVTIIPRADQELTLAGETVAVAGGEPIPVPGAHAVFWCARQAATIAPAPLNG